MTSHRALHAFKWSALSNAASRTIGPLVFLVLARLLAPSDFGVVAAATVVISFSQLFSDAGLAKALVQRQERVADSANAMFWLNLGFGTCVAALVFASAPWIATYFHDDRVTAVVRVLCLQLLLAAAGSVHTALLQRDLAFKRLFWVRLLTTALPALASVPLAMAGFGYWALVAGSLVGQVAQCALLWRASDWRPRAGIDRELAGDLLRFGRWAMVSGLLGWFYLWMDAMIVGHYLGAHDMGLYRTGNALVMMVFGLVFSPMLPVLYSLLSRAQRDVGAVREALLFVAKGITLAAVPIAALLVLFRDPLEQFVFGAQWAGIGNIVGILAVAHGMAWLVGANGEAYRAIGKPHLETWAMGISVLAYLCGYLVSVQYGLIAFALTRCGLVLVGFASQFLIARHALQIPFRRWVGILLPQAIPIGLLVLFLDRATAPSIQGLAIRAMLLAAAYAVLLLSFNREFMLSLRNHFAVARRARVAEAS